MGENIDSPETSLKLIFFLNRFKVNWYTLFWAYEAKILIVYGVLDRFVCKALTGQHAENTQFYILS